MSTEDQPQNESDVELADQTDQDLAEPSFEDGEPPSDVKEQLLAVIRENKGTFITAQLVEPLTDYSEGTVREHLHDLADSGDTNVQRDRRYKEIYGVIIGDNFVVLTDDKDQLLEVVRQYRASKLGAARTLSKEELRSFIIEEVAVSEVTTKTDKLYFGILN